MKLLLTEKERQKAINKRIEKRLKKLELKRKLGILGKFVEFKDHVKKSNANRIVNETKGIYGRSGNRIYILNKSGEFVLFKKLKNSNKAKKYFNNLAT